MIILKIADIVKHQLERLTICHTHDFCYDENMNSMKRISRVND